MRTKRVYQTDPLGYYVAPVDADESPLEEGVFLIPAGAYEDPPPAAEPGFRARRVNDAWTVERLPPPPPDPVTNQRYPVLSQRQFYQALAERELITWDEAFAAIRDRIPPAQLQAMVDGIADERERSRAQLKLIGATEYRIDDPLVIVMATSMGWTDDQLIDLWMMASGL